MKSPVGQLLSAVGTLTALDVNWRTEVHPDDVEGRPDIGVVTDGLLNGHVDLKRPGKGARPEGFTGRDRQQWERFKALPNLIYTDGSEWSLYRSGHLWTVGRGRCSDQRRCKQTVGAGGHRSVRMHRAALRQPDQVQRRRVPAPSLRSETCCCRGWCRGRWGWRGTLSNNLKAFEEETRHVTYAPQTSGTALRQVPPKQRLSAYRRSYQCLDPYIRLLHGH